MSVISDIYRDRTRIDFVKMRWKFLAASILILVICGASLLIRGINKNIDFEGGSQWQVTVQGKDPSVADVRDLVTGAGVTDPRITTLGGSDVRVQAKNVDPTTEADIIQRLAEYAGVDSQEVSFSSVGPTWGKHISHKMVQATGLFFLAVALYLALRLEWKMSVAALVALAHDLLITIGVYSLFQIEVSPATVVAILTILGYSLYDTVVVFDKIKENTASYSKERRFTYSGLANLSLNQTLGRSLNTSVTSILPVLSILVVGAGILGATGLEDFGVALFIGLIAGTYSSIFVASQVLIWWREREPANRELHQRVESRNPGVDVDMLWPDFAPDSTKVITPRPRKGSQGRALPIAADAEPEAVRPVLHVRTSPALDAPPRDAEIPVLGNEDVAAGAEVAPDDDADELAGLPERVLEDAGDEHVTPPTVERIARTATPGHTTGRPGSVAPRAARPRGKKRR